MSDLEKPSSPVKEKMREWSELHPEEAAARLARRQTNREQRKLAAVLSQLIGAETINKAADRLDELLDAETAVVVGAGGGASNVEMVPDNRTRLEAIKVIAAYSEGLPVARQMVVYGDFKDLDEEKRALLMGSRAMQEALADLDEELGLLAPRDGEPLER